MFVEINPYNIDKRLIQSAVDCLKKGELIIFPTDTVYAIVADANSKEGTEKLYNLKKLNKNKPPSSKKVT
jgi:tRNA A37 threonylcarbamoyladenosine synthetase subunit TsaC/SUA5/YrdC